MVTCSRGDDQRWRLSIRDSGDDVVVRHPAVDPDLPQAISGQRQQPTLTEDDTNGTPSSRTGTTEAITELRGGQRHGGW